MAERITRIGDNGAMSEPLIPKGLIVDTETVPALLQFARQIPGHKGCEGVVLMTNTALFRGKPGLVFILQALISGTKFIFTPEMIDTLSDVLLEARTGKPCAVEASADLAFEDVAARG